MTTNHEELCKRLRRCHELLAPAPHLPSACTEAADLIEAQAARIQQQALENITLFDQCSEALKWVKALEAENKRDRLEFRADCERQAEEEVKLRKRIADLEAQIGAT
jgi:hypothetical protein